MLDINVRAPFILSAEVARRLLAAKKPGRIINIASMAAFHYSGNGAALYSVSKAAVARMTEALAVEWSAAQINVNAIAPGVVDGEHWEHVDAMFAKLEGKPLGQKKAEVAAGVPAGRFATPADLTGMAVFLASPEADYIVAQTYNVDGGQWMS